MDRIEARQRDESSAFGGNEGADIDGGEADDTIERREDFGIGKVEFGRLLAALETQYIGLGLFQLRVRRVECRLSDRVGCDQPLCAVTLENRKVPLGLRRRYRTLDLLQGGAIGAVLHLVKRGSGGDLLPILEVNLFDEAGHAGAHGAAAAFP